MCRNCSRMMGGMLELFLSMDSYRSRRAKWRHAVHKNVQIQYDYPASFVQDKQILKPQNEDSSSPAVMYWEGALAPEDRKAPEYLHKDIDALHKIKSVNLIWKTRLNCTSWESLWARAQSVDTALLRSCNMCCPDWSTHTATPSEHDRDYRNHSC